MIQVPVWTGIQIFEAMTIGMGVHIPDPLWLVALKCFSNCQNWLLTVLVSDLDLCRGLLSGLPRRGQNQAQGLARIKDSARSENLLVAVWIIQKGIIFTRNIIVIDIGNNTRYLL